MGVFSDGFVYMLFYLPLYFLFTLIQKLYWVCNGMSDIVSQVESDQLYERSAQVFDIWYKLKKEPFQTLSRWNFIAAHRSFEHPNYVLSYNVSLLAVEMDQAIFVEVPYGYDIFDCKKSPFIHLGQFDEAIRIITMPISSLIRCADELGDPKMKVIWLHSTGRCGSTAMSQVFESIPNCTTISEPMCLIAARSQAAMSLTNKQFRQWNDSELHKKMLQAAVRIMAKPNEHNPEILFIKNFTLTGVIEVPDIEKFFPSHINLFLYRDCLDTVQSYMRSLNNHFLLNIVMKLRGNAVSRYLIRSPKVLIRLLAPPDIVDLCPWLSDPATQLSMTSFGLITILWCVLLYHYIHLVVNKKSSVRAIRYEDIVNDTHTTLTQLFIFCGISLDHLEAAKKSLEVDSQEGTVLSKASLGKFKKVHVTEGLREEANMYLKACKLAELGQPTYLPELIGPNAPSKRVPSCDSVDGLCNGGSQHITINMPA